MMRKGESAVHVAIREALVNSLIHADYQGQGGIVIEKYPDSFEFANPGSLLISFDQVLRGGVSECRNRSLQTMFTMIGAAERAGSGIDKIKIGWDSQHWRSPIVREQMRPDRVIWVLPMLSLIPEESLERLKNRFGSRFSNFSKLEVQALVTADVEGYVDNARMRQITDHHASDITKLLQDLVSRGILLQDGQGRWTQYCLPSDLDSIHIDNDTVHTKTGSLHKGDHTIHKGNHTIHKITHTVHKNDHIVHSAEISPKQWEHLEELALPARINKRLQTNEMESIILKLCKDQWLTRRQISALVDRNSDGLRARFLTPMVEHERLELRYPDKPKRTDQAYRTAR